MGKQPHRTKEYRLQAAALVVRHGYTQAEAARRLGVSPQTLANWIKAFRASGELNEDEATLRAADENRKLREENRRLRLENEILKKRRRTSRTSRCEVLACPPKADP